MKIFQGRKFRSRRIPDIVHANLEKVESFEKKHHRSRSALQKVIEQFSLFFGSLSFFAFFVALNVGWILSDVAWRHLGHPYFDAPPFTILQDIVTYIGVFITMAVLIRQNRLSQVEETRAQLELQVNLLSEQKITKIIDLLEELRRDMPGIKQRSDDHTDDLRQTMNADLLLEELENRKRAAG
jgi:uncharacterized membrane protein